MEEKDELISLYWLYNLSCEFKKNSKNKMYNYTI